MSRGRIRTAVSQPSWSDAVVDLPSHVALEAAHDLLLRHALLGAPLDVGPGAGVTAHPHQHDLPQGAVGLAVTAPVEPVAHDAPGRGLDGRGAAQSREGAFVVQ